MTNLSNEQQYENLSEVLDFIFEQRFKSLYTCLPGVIVSYDAVTKRALVQPALRRVLTDDTEELLPEIANVPVCFPTGGGFSLLFPVKKDDTCLLLFSQRGIENFKQTYEVENPDEGLLDLNDAIAIMGFGPLTLTPASETGTALQSDDGTEFISVETGKITIKSTVQVIVNAVNVEVNATAKTTVNALDVEVNAIDKVTVTTKEVLIKADNTTIDGNLKVINGDITHEGVKVGKDHLHSNVAVGTASSGPVVP